MSLADFVQFIHGRHKVETKSRRESDDDSKSYRNASARATLCDPTERVEIIDG